MGHPSETKNPEVSEVITFEQAIATTRNLLENFLQGDLSPEHLQIQVANLLRTINGARGFFVVFLTHDWQVPTESIVNALNTCPDHSTELMIKNLVMSTAMAITHQRHNDPTQAEMSLATARRSTAILNLWNHPSLVTIVQSMEESIDKGEGDYADFLKKWGYDSEQKQAMKKALTTLRL